MEFFLDRYEFIFYSWQKICVPFTTFGINANHILLHVFLILSCVKGVGVVSLTILLDKSECHGDVSMY